MGFKLNGAAAIEWKLKQLNKWDKPSICTKQIGETDQSEITKWVGVDMVQPDDATVTTWISEYEAQYTKPKTSEERIAELEKKTKNL